MKIEILMPRMRPEMKSGVLCAWLKDEGERVIKGEPLFEVETEKVVSQVEAEADGVLEQWLAEEGDEIAAETAVAVLETEK
jgi:pyruvate/2-oxoglutarate dehydrogenase complex dihydrolipoamide acyltransferase (E2) component